MGPVFSLLLFVKIEASVWLKSLLLCLVGDFFEEEGGNFRSSEVKVRSKCWQLFKINEQPHHKGFSVTLETPFQKMSWSNFSFRLPSALLPPMQILFLHLVYPV